MSGDLKPTFTKISAWRSGVLNRLRRRPWPPAQADSSSGIDLSYPLRIIRQTGYPDPESLGIRGDRLVEYVIMALCELTLHDGLTELLNARHFRTTLDHEADRAARTGHPCALLLVDLDHFKAINDRYGHPFGDHVLQVVGRLIKSSVRTIDIPARYGGEEFAAILPNTGTDDAVRVAERLRTRIEHEVIPHEGGVVRITASIGVSSLLPAFQGNGADLLKRADRELYRAKTMGRNRVCYEAPRDLPVSANERAALLQR